jgi:uncharacterized protein (UPF0261 family)
VRILLPMKGLSTVDNLAIDPVRDRLYDSLEASIAPAADRQISRLQWNINDREFVDAIVSSVDAVFK